MRPFFVLLTSILLLGGCVTTVEVNHYPNVGHSITPGFYSDSQKWERVRHYIGSRETLSRGEMLQGTSRYVANIIRRKLVEATGYRGWVCRQRRQYNVVVVRCARHHKLQHYVPFNNAEAFNMQLQPFLRWGAAPVYIDWGIR